MSRNSPERKIGSHNRVAGRRSYPVNRRRVPGIYKIHIVKQAGPGHELLRTGPLLRRTSEVNNRSILFKLFQIIFDCNFSRQGSCSQNTMAAPGLPLFLDRERRLLTESRQGIVFAQDPHHRFSCSKDKGSCKAGWNPRQTRLHSKAGLLQESAQKRR